MNDTIRSILTRRSIKVYRPDQIKGEELEMILLAGKYAASGRNRQPWYFVVVQDKDVLLEINSTILAGRPARPTPPGAPQRPSLLESAPALIIVFGDSTVPTAIHDCTLAMGNMMLAATSMGLGSNWIHAIVRNLPQTEAGKALFQQWEVPAAYVPYAAAVFGYPGAEPAQRSPRKEGVVKIIG
ncbi:MAG: nitroreductase family protein [Firmicutes bacterium]|nr:nitroreductase family protein [Bacillota bacterium]